MLAAHPLAGLVSDAILLHHERPDGGGTPSDCAAWKCLSPPGWLGYAMRLTP